MTNPTPDFRTELARLVDLYYALGGNWCPHGYTDTWNDALASALTALATPPQEPPRRPTEQEVADMAEELTWKRLPQDDESTDSFLLDVVNAALERWGHG